jgi:hypothetical protein
MSTKIFNAYKYNGSLIDLIIELKKIRSLHIEKSKGLVLRTATQLRKNHKNKDNKVRFINDIVSLIKLGRNSISYKIDAIEIDADAAIFPLGDREFLVQFFRVNHDIEIKEPFIDYHYQNQTDQPEEISDEEWETRKEVWDKVFKDDWTPAGAGVVFEICGASQDFDMFNYLLKNLEEDKNDKTI